MCFEKWQQIAVILNTIFTQFWLHNICWRNKIFIIALKNYSFHITKRKYPFQRLSLSSLYLWSLYLVTGLLVVVQIVTFFALKRRHEFRSGTGTVAAGNQARRKLYVKAMVKSWLISMAFIIGWMPLCICTILYDWAPGVDKLMLNALIPNLTMLSSVQAVCNAFILWVLRMDCCNK